MDWKKWLRSFMHNQRRQQQRVSSVRYTLDGGPWDGEMLCLSESLNASTLTFRVKNWVGYYKAVGDARRMEWRNEK